MTVSLVATKKEYTATMAIDEAAGGGALLAILYEKPKGVVLMMTFDKNDDNGHPLLKGQPTIYTYLKNNLEAAKPKAVAIIEAVVAGWAFDV